MSKETTTNMEKYYIETYSENIPFSRSRTKRGKKKPPNSELLDEVKDVFVDLVGHFLIKKMSHIFQHNNFLQQWNIFLKSTIVYVIIFHP